MKDIGRARKILGMKIIRNRINKILYLKQTSSLEKIISKFSMTNAKTTSVLISDHFKFSSGCQYSEEDKEDMMNAP